MSKANAEVLKTTIPQLFFIFFSIWCFYVLFFLYFLENTSFYMLC